MHRGLILLLKKRTSLVILSTHEQSFDLDSVGKVPYVRAKLSEKPNMSITASITVYLSFVRWPKQNQLACKTHNCTYAQRVSHLNFTLTSSTYLNPSANTSKQFNNCIYYMP